jgi:SagB-type dehydrogenase family enzyme
LIGIYTNIKIARVIGRRHMKRVLALSVALVLIFMSMSCTPSPEVTPTSPVTQLIINLPEPRLESNVSLEETLLNRRSIREYANTPLALKEVSQLLWAAQGLTAEWGGRTAPSAGGLYPLEIYLAAGSVENLAAGIYKYKPEGHELAKLRDGDVREELTKAALDQAWVKEGAIDLVIAAVYDRTTDKYGDRGVRYVDMEAGHAAQNLYLQATVLNLGMVTIGSFHDEQVKSILGMLQDEFPLYVIPVGKKKA